MPIPSRARKKEADAESKKALLDSANGAITATSLLHVALVVLCAYVLVVVLGTTDLDLLRGRSIKLPALDTQVPLLSFFLLAPVLVVAVHANLLVQLQLLARKLHAMSTMFPAVRPAGGWRDRLQTFPFPNYVIAQSGTLPFWLIEAVVGLTVIVFPLFTLACVLGRFLAYQSIYVSWGHRLAIWIDLAILVTIWPIIVQAGSLSDYMSSLKNSLRIKGRAVLVPAVAAAAFLVVSIFCQTPILFLVALAGAITATFFARHRAHKLPSTGTLPRGAGIVFFVALLSTVVPIGMTVDGEAIDSIQLADSRWLAKWHTQKVDLDLSEFPASSRTSIELESRTLFRDALHGARHIDASGAILVAEPAKPEVIDRLRSKDPSKVRAAAASIEPLDLSGRSFRRAVFVEAVMPRIILKDADLVGAVFTGTVLADANLTSANAASARLFEVMGPGLIALAANFKNASLTSSELADSNFTGADFRGANLDVVDFVGAKISTADFRGARVSNARMSGATLNASQFEGVRFWDADIRAADFTSAKLRGADFSGMPGVGSHLEGTNFQKADLAGANFAYANLTAAEFQNARLLAVNLRGASVYLASGLGSAEIVDARELTWKRPDEKTLSLSREELLSAGGKSAIAPGRLLGASERIERLGLTARGDPPQFAECLRDSIQRPNDAVICKIDWDESSLPEFRKRNLESLRKLACGSKYIAANFAAKSDPYQPDNGRFGIFQVLSDRIGDGTCEGVESLDEQLRASLRSLARSEFEARKKLGGGMGAQRQ